MNKNLTAILAMLLSIGATAQNLNPEIVVTNEYETKMPSVPKKDLPMACPDSLTDFKFRIDYSVFDNPYKGAYEFSPYVVELSPQKASVSSSRFFLRAGVGFTLHPVLDFAWVPVRKNGAYLTVYQGFSGYYGPYRTVGDDLRTVPGQRFNGYDLAENFGATARFRIKNAELFSSVGYEGLYSGDGSDFSGWNALSVSLGVRSSATGTASLRYDFSLGLGMGADSWNGQGIGEQTLGLSGRIEPRIRKLPFRIVADLGITGVNVTGAFATSELVLSLAPKAVFSFGSLNLLAGVNICGPSLPADSHNQFRRIGQFIYPDVSADLDLFKGALTLYAGIKGGVNPRTYSDLKRRNHRLVPSWATDGVLIDNEIERMNASLGLRGVITEWFQYDASAGYGFYAGSPFFNVSRTIGTDALKPSLCWADQGLFHADIRGSLHRKGIGFDAALSFRKADVAAGTPVILPALFEGEGIFTYSYAGRVTASLSAHASSSRKAFVPEPGQVGAGATLAEASIPGYLDLGIGAEYSVSRHWTLWGKIDNLLDADIQLLPLYVENGVNFTLGICLKL